MPPRATASYLPSSALRAAGRYILEDVWWGRDIIVLDSPWDVRHIVQNILKLHPTLWGPGVQETDP